MRYQLYNYVHTYYHMWQSWVEIEHYSVAYCDRITKFETL